MWWWGPCAGCSCASDVVARDFTDLRPLMTDRASTAAGAAPAPGLYTARLVLTQEVAALKVLDKRALRDRRTRRRLRRELRVLELARGQPHLLALHGVYASRTRVEIAFELARGGDAMERLTRSFSEREASRMTAQVASGLRFLHARGLIHGEVRPEHVLYSDDEPDARVLLAAFGRAAPWQQLSLRCRPRTRGFLWDDVHHIRFLPPFVLRRRGEAAKSEAGVVATWQEAQQLDVWALGVTLFVLLCGGFPFDRQDGEQEQEGDVVAIERRVLGERLAFPRGGALLSRAARDMLRRLLEKDASKAMSLEEVTAHPWLGGDVAPAVSWSDDMLAPHRAFAARYAEEVAAVSRRRRVSPRSFSLSLRGHDGQEVEQAAAAEEEAEEEERPSFVSTHGTQPPLDEDERPSAECFMRLASLAIDGAASDEDVVANPSAGAADPGDAESGGGKLDNLWQVLVRQRRFLSFKSMGTSSSSLEAASNA
ncbi:hypothetical protein BBJ28_00012603 [Nothophytophthora sp. Chile5]|nr:hypothetical protein BBJ28_00012603 [Nothophytophthora sp. Chile5]